MAKYIATPEEELEQYQNALNLAATFLVSIIADGPDDGLGDDSSLVNAVINWEEYTNLKNALIELGYEIK